MSNYRKHIDDFFREKLGNYRETPPPEAWAELEEKLDGLTPALPGSPFRLLKHIAIITLLMVMGVSVGKKLIGHSDNDAASTTSKTDAGKRLAAKVTNANAVADRPASGMPVMDGTAQRSAMESATENTGTGANPVVTNSGRDQVTGKKSKPGKPHLLKSRTSQMHKEEPDTWTGLKPATETFYHATGSTLPKFESTVNNNTAASPGLALSTDPIQEDILPGTSDKNQKKQVEASSKEELKKAASMDHGIGFRRFEAGIKGGYETGFIDAAAAKVVVSPYLQYNISPKMALMTQPAIKYATVGSRNAGNAQSYYDNQTVTNESTTNPNTRIVNGSYDTISYTTTFKYSESHDSIVKSYKYGGSYIEFELPILLKYAITKQFSAYGGVNLVYAKFSGYSSNTFVRSGIHSADSVTVTTLPGDPIRQPDGFGYTPVGTPFTKYTPEFQNPATSLLHIGYMVGFTYTYSNRWLADALLQQAPVSASGNTNATFSTPYFRFSVGYKLSK